MIKSERKEFRRKRLTLRIANNLELFPRYYDKDQFIKNIKKITDELKNNVDRGQIYSDAIYRMRLADKEHHRLFGNEFFDQLLNEIDDIDFIMILMQIDISSTIPDGNKPYMREKVAQKINTMSQTNKDLLYKHTFREEIRSFLVYKKMNPGKSLGIDLSNEEEKDKLKFLVGRIEWAYDVIIVHVKNVLELRLLVMIVLEWLLVLDPDKEKKNESVGYRFNVGRIYDMIQTLAIAVNCKDRISWNCHSNVLKYIVALLSISFSPSDKFQGYKNIPAVFRILVPIRIKENFQDPLSFDDIGHFLLKDIKALADAIQALIAYDCPENSIALMSALTDRLIGDGYIMNIKFLECIFKNFISTYTIKLLDRSNETRTDLKLCETYFYGFCLWSFKLSGGLLKDMINTIQNLSVNSTTHLLSFTINVIDFFENILKLYAITDEPNIENMENLELLYLKIRNMRLELKVERSQDFINKVIIEIKARGWSRLEVSTDDNIIDLEKSHAREFEDDKDAEVHEIYHTIISKEINDREDQRVQQEILGMILEEEPVIDEVYRTYNDSDYDAEGLYKIPKSKLVQTRTKEFKVILNVGMTCYLSSVLQAVFFSNEFTSVITTLHMHDLTIREEDKKFLSELEVLLSGLLDSDSPFVDPSDFKATLPHPFGDSTKEQDAAQFLEMFLNKTHSALEQTGERLKELVQDTFSLNVETTWECQQCMTSFSKGAILLSITLPFSQEVMGFDDQKDMLFRAYQPEYLEGNNAKYCDVCEQKSVSTLVTTSIVKLPSSLVITLSRFSYRSGVKVKISTKVNLYDRIDLNEVLGNQLKVLGALYDLYAVIMHIGRDIDFGHYICIVRSHKYKGGWVILNDTDASVIKNYTSIKDFTEEFPSFSPYVLFYRNSTIT